MNGTLRYLHSLGRVDHSMVPFLSLRLVMKGIGPGESPVFI